MSFCVWSRPAVTVNLWTLLICIQCQFRIPVVTQMSGWFLILCHQLKMHRKRLTPNPSWIYRVGLWMGRKERKMREVRQWMSEMGHKEIAASSHSSVEFTLLYSLLRWNVWLWHAVDCWQSFSWAWLTRWPGGFLWIHFLRIYKNHEFQTLQANSICWEVDVDVICS